MPGGADALVRAGPLGPARHPMEFGPTRASAAGQGARPTGGSMLSW
jgi:hypothetical protein